MRFGTPRWSAELDCPSVSLREEALRVLGWLASGEGLPAPAATFRLEGRGGSWQLDLDGQAWERAPDPEGLLAAFHWHVTQTAFRSTPGHAAFHAGLAAFDGRSLLVPGPSGAGKSTLTLACCLRGAAYGSDDLTWFDLASGELVPFPVSLALGHRALDRLGPAAPSPMLVAETDWEPGERRRCLVHPEDFAPARAEAAPPAAVVIRGAEREGPPRLDRLAEGEALHALYPHAQFLWQERARVFQALSTLAARVPVYLGRGPSAGLAEKVRELG
ncbi:MAG: hypothetical protein R6W82_03910 [bacterium]